MEYLKNNASLDCDKGLWSRSLTVTSNNKVINRDGVFATNKDNLGGINIHNFGTCKLKGICRANFDLEGVSFNWIDTVPKLSILGLKPLSDKSKLICPYGGIITVKNSGQI